MPRGCRGAVPGGGGLPPLRGAPGVRRCPSPGRPSSGAGSQGFVTRVSRVRSVQAWGPSTGPTACALAGRRCSLWGWGKGVPGGGCLPPLWGASEARRRPSPDCPPTGRAVWVRHPRAVGAGVCVWGPNTVLSACMPYGGCMPRGWWGAVPGGVVCHRFEGRLVSGAVPPPAARPLERAARVPQPVCPGCGRCGHGDPAPAPTECALAGPRCSLWGWRKGEPRGGVPSTIVRGV